MFRDPDPVQPSTSVVLYEAMSTLHELVDPLNPGLSTMLALFLIRQVHAPLAQLGVEPAQTMQDAPQWLASLLVS